VAGFDPGGHRRCGVPGEHRRLQATFEFIMVELSGSTDMFFGSNSCAKTATGRGFGYGRVGWQHIGSGRDRSRSCSNNSPRDDRILSRRCS
jgi:hypothetical protein